jgi:hypothetical protein
MNQDVCRHHAGDGWRGDRMRQNLRMSLTRLPRRIIRGVYGLGCWRMEVVVHDRSPEQVRAALSTSIRSKRGPMAWPWGVRYASDRHRITLGVNTLGQAGDHADLQTEQAGVGGTRVSVAQGPNHFSRIFMSVWLTTALLYVFAGFVSLGIGLLRFVQDGQIADLGGAVGIPVALGMFGVGRGMLELGRRSDTKHLQEVVGVAVGSDQALHWVVN